ncbi:MAG: TrmH family RNA methyltransferase, partial [Flavobacteriales bacterium]
MKKDVKLVRSLHQKKFRNESGLFIVEGRKMVDEALNSHFRPHSLYTTDQHFAHAMPEAILATQREMEMMSTLATASQHLAVLYQNNETFKNLQSEQMILVLDGISDPGNMGTMLRNADWFGVRQVLCTNDCVELYNPKVVQSTMGSIFRVRVMYSEVSEILDMLRKSQFGIAGAVMNGESLYESA